MIPNLTLEFEISSDDYIKFADFAGVALRAALYTAFTQLYDTGKTIGSNKDVTDNPLRWIFAPSDQSHMIPRPYIIRPPLKVKKTGFKFGITLLGNATKYVQQIISCVVGMQSIGLGINRQSFRIKSVSQVNLFTGERVLLLDQNGNSIHPIQISNEIDDLKSAIGNVSSDVLSIKFLTPTMIIDKRELLTEPVFRPLFQRLLERFLLLNKYYGNRDIDVELNYLLEQASQIKIITNDTHMYGKKRGKRYSRNIAGFVGDVEYEGDLTSFILFIAIGQLVNVGKNVTKGCGWFQVEYS